MPVRRLPRWAAWVLTRATPPRDRAAVLGDLEEEFGERCSSGDAAAAERWLRSQILRSLIPGLARRFGTEPPAVPAHRGSVMSSFIQDLQFAWRSLRRRPGLVMAAMVSLVVGLTSTTLVFSMLDAAVLRPLSITDPSRLVLLEETRERDVNRSFSYPHYQAFRDGVAKALSLVAIAETEVTWSTGGEARRLSGEIVTGNYFGVLGIRTTSGRALSPDDDADAAMPVVVVSARFASRYFLGATAIGQSITLNRVAFTIVGVAAAPFGGMQVGREADFWVPMHSHPVLNPPARGLLQIPNRGWLTVLGRLEGDVSRATALAALATLEAGTERRSPFTGERMPSRRFELRPGAQGDSEMTTQMASPLQLLLAAAAFVLLIACVNVTNLLLARAADRSREFAVRTALGAGRWRLVRLQIAEGFVLSGVAAGLSLVITQLSARAFVPFLATFGRTPDLDVSINLRVLGFGIALVAVSTLFLSIAPALAAVRTAVSSSLADGGRQVSSSNRGWAARGLVALQFALSLALVAASVLMIRTVINLKNVDTGFAIDELAVFSVDAASAAHTGPRLTDYQLRAIAALEAVPGVRSVALATVEPIDVGGRRRTIVLPGEPLPRPGGDNTRGEINYNEVSSSYFAAMGIPIRAGRAFSEADTPTTPAAVVVNETMAKKLWPERSPIGEQLRFGPPSAPWAEVVGVVPDVKYRSLRDSAVPSFYLALSQLPPGRASFHVRTVGPAERLLPQLERALVAVDPGVPVLKSRSLAEQRSVHMAPDRIAMTITFALGSAALLLSSLGLYGAVADSVGKRTREIGLRMALGASPSTILGQVVRQGFVAVGVGAVGGVLLSAWAATLIESRLFGVPSRDLVSLACGMVLLLLVAALATWLPARRATKVDPAHVLRD